MGNLHPAVRCGAVAVAAAISFGAAVPAEAGDILFRPARLDFETRYHGVLALEDLDGDGILDAEDARSPPASISYDSGPAPPPSAARSCEPPDRPSPLVDRARSPSNQ